MVSVSLIKQNASIHTKADAVQGSGVKTCCWQMFSDVIRNCEAFTCEDFEEVAAFPPITCSETILRGSWGILPSMTCRRMRARFALLLRLMWLGTLVLHVGTRFPACWENRAPYSSCKSVFPVRHKQAAMR